MKNKKTKNLLILVVIIIALALIGNYAYGKYTGTADYKTKKDQAEAANLVSAVSKLMLLPADETPAIFVVQDPNQLISQQPFFKGAQKDDRLMVYQKSGKAILYSPSRNMIVNVGPVTFDQPPVATPSVSAPDQSKASTSSKSDTKTETTTKPTTKK